MSGILIPSFSSILSNFKKPWNIGQSDDFSAYSYTSTLEDLN